MKILVAEDDPFFRKLLKRILASDCEVVAVEDGNAAWRTMQENQKPMLAVLDWVMPGMAGPQICREARAHTGTVDTYIILLTAKNSPADILAGLRAGADDYVTKPFEPEELRARVRVGRRVIEMQAAMVRQAAELENALSREKALETRLNVLQENPQKELVKGASA